ncbi:MAG: KH domain-containing protein [bacterium]
MKQLLQYILIEILGPDAEIKIEETENAGEIVYNLLIPESDRPLIIGKNGINIKAIRTLISIIAHREQKRVYIKIVD